MALGCFLQKRLHHSVDGVCRATHDITSVLDGHVSYTVNGEVLALLGIWSAATQLNDS
jgi:hypothetical protein